MLSNQELFFKHIGLPSLQPLGLEIVDAEGIFLLDKAGNKYIDLISGVSVSNLGHKHPAIVKAVQEQAGKYMHLMVYGEMVQSPQVQLATKLAENLPTPLDCTYFVSSGSEAIEGAVKLAKRFTGRTEIVSFKDAYHGGTHGALSILGNEELKYAFRPLLPDVRIIEFDDMEALEQITEKTACVVAETIQAEAGIILPRYQYMKSLRERCTETGALLVIDDIQMGMGRTGKLFSFEHYDIQPDILALAKAFGGGMPLGAFIASREVMRTLTSNPELGHITTFGGHPVSCAAGLASMEVILKENLAEEANRKGLRFYEALNDHPAIREIRYRGLMMAVDVGSEKVMQKLFPALIENGLIVDQFLFNRRSFRIAPPLVISDDEISDICQTIHICFDNI